MSNHIFKNAYLERLEKFSYEDNLKNFTDKKDEVLLIKSPSFFSIYEGLLKNAKFKFNDETAEFNLGCNKPNLHEILNTINDNNLINSRGVNTTYLAVGFFSKKIKSNNF